MTVWNTVNGMRAKEISATVTLGQEYGPVYFIQYADSSLVMASTVYYEPTTLTEDVKSGINTRVKQALDENGIEIPYNYVNVVVNERKESTRQLNVKEIIFATAVAGYYHCIMLP